MKTQSRTCWVCNAEIQSIELEQSQIPITTDGIPEYYVSKIILNCPNGHPNECEVLGV